MATSDPAPFTIRLGGPDDDERIAALLAAANPGNPKAELDVLRWQYRRETFGPTLTVVAESGGELVGHYSAITVPFRLGGRETTALRGVDIVTAVEARGRGVFGKVAERLRDAARETGADLLISTPNDASIGTLLRLGWGHVGDPVAMVAVVDPRALSARLPSIVPGVAASAVAALLRRRQREAPVAGATEVVDGLDARLAAQLGTLRPAGASELGIGRDARWWTWRYGDHPRSPYQVVVHRRHGRLGAVAVVSPRPADEVLQLLDLVAADRASLLAVGHATTTLARDLGLGAVVAATMPDSLLHHQLGQAGFVAVPRRFQPRPVHLVANDLSGAYGLRRGDRWAFTLGDQDHL